MLQRQHTTVIYIPSLRTDPPTVGLNLQALKSLLPWSVGELVTGVHPLAQNPSYLTWRWHLDGQGRGKQREALLFCVPLWWALSFPFWYFHKSARSWGRWDREGGIKSESLGHPGGEQLSLRLLQCVSTRERILLFPRGFAASPRTFHLRSADKGPMHLGWGRNLRKRVQEK